MKTVGGQIGHITGSIAQALVPGGAMKLAANIPRLGALDAAGSAYLAPQTIPGAAAVGATQGFMQPVASDESRLHKTTVGAIGGAAIPAAAGAAGLVGDLVSPFFRSGQEKLAGRTLERFATNPASIINPQHGSELIPGSLPTLAQASGDTGLAQLERGLINNLDSNAQLVARQGANRDARFSALSDIAGNPADRAAWVKAREDVAKQNYGQAFGETPVLTPWVKGQLTQLSKRPAFNEAWSSAERLALEEGRKLGPSDVVPMAHYAKMALDDMIGKAAGNEQRALMGTRDQLVSLLESKDFAPSYQAARQTYADMSKPINQMDVGQALMEKFQPALADFGATTRQTAASYAQALRHADVTAQRATGFPGARMADVLGPDQMGTVTNLARDLARQTKAQELGMSRGSPTTQNFVTQDIMRQSLGPLGLPQSWAEAAIPQQFQRLARYAFTAPENKVMGLLGQAAADPELAKQLLLKSRKRSQAADLIDLLTQASPSIGAGSLLGYAP